MRSLTPIFAVLRAAALVVLVVAVAACARNGASGTGVGNGPGFSLPAFPGRNGPTYMRASRKRLDFSDRRLSKIALTV